MPVISVFLIILIVLLLIVLFLKVFIRLAYDIDENDKFSLEIMFVGRLIKLPVNFEKEIKHNEKKLISIFEDFTNITDKLRLSGNIIKKALKKIKLEKFDVKITLGTDDAAKTGIFTGTLWGVIYNIDSIINNLFSVGKTNYDISPDFEHEKLYGHVESIISIRPVNIIFILFLILSFYNSQKRI